MKQKETRREAKHYKQDKNDEEISQSKEETSMNRNEEQTSSERCVKFLLLNKRTN